MAHLLRFSLMASAALGLHLSDSPPPELKAKRAGIAARGQALWASKGALVNTLSGQHYFGTEVYQVANSTNLIKKVRSPSRYLCKENGTQCHFEPHAQCEHLRKINEAYGETGSSPVVQCLEDHAYRRQDPFILVTGGIGLVRDWIKRWYVADMPPEAMWAFMSQMYSNHVALMASGSQLYTYEMAVFPDGPRFIDADPESAATCPIARQRLTEKLLVEVQDGMTSLIEEQKANNMDLEDWRMQFKVNDERDDELLVLAHYLDELRETSDQCTIETEEHMKAKKKFKSKAAAGQLLKEFEAEYLEVAKEKEGYGELF